jgi:two-component system chemotaxis response regulator CheB
LRVLKMNGGVAVVQDPEDAHFDGMPRAAIALAGADRLARSDAIAGVLCELVEEPLALEPAALPDLPGGPVDHLQFDSPSEIGEQLEGPPSGLTCPECGGALWELDEAGGVRFACHVGHAFSIASLAEEQGRSLETTLWSAVRALEERADMHRRLSRRASGARAEVYIDRAQEAEHHADTLRAMLGRAGRLAAPAPEHA